MQSQKAVAACLKSKQLLPFGFAERDWRRDAGIRGLIHRSELMIYANARAASVNARTKSTKSGAKMPQPF